MCDNPMRFRQGAIAAGGPITVDVRSAVVPSEGDAQAPRCATFRLTGYHQTRVRDTGRSESGARPQHTHPRLLAGGLSSILHARSPGFDRVTEHWLGYLGCGQISSRN